MQGISLLNLAGFGTLQPTEFGVFNDHGMGRHTVLNIINFWSKHELSILNSVSYGKNVAVNELLVQFCLVGTMSRKCGAAVWILTVNTVVHFSSHNELSTLYYISLIN